MTDTGQIPGEGLPENAGGQQQEGQPGVPASGAYPFADPAAGVTDGLGTAPDPHGAPGPHHETHDPHGLHGSHDEEDLLLMPSAQGAWSEQPAPGPAQPQGQAPQAQPMPQPQPEHPGPPGPMPDPGGYGYAYDPHAQAAGGHAAQQPFTDAQLAQPAEPYAPEATYGQGDAVGVNGYAQHGPQPGYGPESAYPQQHVQPDVQPAEPQAAAQPQAEPGPAPDAVPQPDTAVAAAPGPHETDGRDSGAIDVSAVRPPQQPQTAQTSTHSTPSHGTRRPLHLGPPVPEQSGTVRPLSERPTAQAATPQAAPVQGAPAGRPTAPAQPAAPADGRLPGEQPQRTVGEDAQQAPAPQGVQAPLPADAAQPAGAAHGAVAGEAVPGEQQPAEPQSAGPAVMDPQTAGAQPMPVQPADGQPVRADDTATVHADGTVTVQADGTVTQPEAQPLPDGDPSSPGAVGVPGTVPEQGPGRPDPSGQAVPSPEPQATAPVVEEPLPGPQLGQLPPETGEWSAQQAPSPADPAASAGPAVPDQATAAGVDAAGTAVPSAPNPLAETVAPAADAENPPAAGTPQQTPAAQESATAPGDAGTEGGGTPDATARDGQAGQGGQAGQVGGDGGPGDGQAPQEQPPQEQTPQEQAPAPAVAAETDAAAAAAQEGAVAAPLPAEDAPVNDTVPSPRQEAQPGGLATVPAQGGAAGEPRQQQGAVQPSPGTPPINQDADHQTGAQPQPPVIPGQATAPASPAATTTDTTQTPPDAAPQQAEDAPASQAEDTPSPQSADEASGPAGQEAPTGGDADGTDAGARTAASGADRAETGGGETDVVETGAVTTDAAGAAAAAATAETGAGTAAAGAEAAGSGAAETGSADADADAGEFDAAETGAAEAVEAEAAAGAAGSAEEPQSEQAATSKSDEAAQAAESPAAPGTPGTPGTPEGPEPAAAETQQASAQPEADEDRAAAAEPVGEAAESAPETAASGTAASESAAVAEATTSASPAAEPPAAAESPATPQPSAASVPAPEPDAATGADSEAAVEAVAASAPGETAASPAGTGAGAPASEAPASPEEEAPAGESAPPQGESAPSQEESAPSQEGDGGAQDPEAESGMATGEDPVTEPAAGGTEGGASAGPETTDETQEATAADAGTAEAEAVATETADEEPVEAQAAETETVDTKTAGAQGADAETTDEAQAAEAGAGTAGEEAEAAEGEAAEVPQGEATQGEAAGGEAAEGAGTAPDGGDPPTGEPEGEPAPGFAEAEREAVHRLMRERRDIRNGFRPDPIPHEVLLRVLEAAHTAPSVGHSQPWDFVVIRSEETRRTMHELAERQREAYAKSLPKGRAKQFKEMKIEAILDTPVNIVVTADPTRGGRHTLGRQTQPQMAPYSSALAVENLWLAARAEGLGVGWVSFFDERELVRTLELPEHLEVVAYLCVGYVDEFPDEPELMQAGWSKRRPLSWVVHDESYGRRALPGAEPTGMLAETLGTIRPLDAKALGEAWERQKRMTKPSGALGMLEIISAQLCGLSRKCPPPIPEPAAVAVFAGDHGVHAQGVTPWPQEVTAQMVGNFLGGGAVCNAFANQVGAEVCVVDVGVAAELPAQPGLLPRKVRPGTADMTAGPALSREEVERAVEVGIETARDLVAAGNKALLTGEMGIANTTASAALIAACTGADPAEVTGRGTGINDETHARKVEVVRRALERHQPDPADPIGMLEAFGGLEHAALVGLILGGASLRTPVILDGVSAGAAALVARAVAPEALAACIAGHRSAEPGHVAALTKLGLRPLVDLDLRLGEGTGALLALPMVQSAARAMHEVATFDGAGVTEKG